MNPYKEILKQSLPRLINMINQDVESGKYGYADRQFWGWKTIDFPNGTYQGICHSLAIAVKLELIDKSLGLKLVDDLVNSVPKIAHRNGAVEEAFPEENSFCVTALVAFDCLSAIFRLKDDLDEQQIQDYLSIVKPLIGFISSNDETHAIISNHLATGVAAIALWNHLSEDTNNRDKELLEIIYKHQSEEGWFLEYDGADPGYQTLCTYYLAAAQEVLQDDQLKDRIEKSISFLKHFIHPNSTIGGLYGSRNTEVYYPGGVTFFCDSSQEASAIDVCMQKGLNQEINILPQTIDRENLIPLVNSYAFAAFHYQEKTSDVELPFTKKFEIDFSQSGIYIHSNENYYCIVNYKKGGVIKVIDKKLNTIDIEDGGLIITNMRKKASTQIYSDAINFNNKDIKTQFFILDEGYPSYFQFGLIRLFALTIFKFRFLREVFKQAVVKLLITGKKKVEGVSAIRNFSFLENEVIVEDQVKGLDKNWKVERPGFFKSIHMASSGYNTFQNLKRNKGNIVQFKLK